MKRLVVLHTNDVHGAVDGLARVATLVAQARVEAVDAAVIYVDAGDVEEPSNELSSITKGVALVRLLGAAGCDAAAVGNAALLRYGPGAVEAEAQAAGFPLLLANVRQPDGTLVRGVQASAVLERAGVRVGVIGVTSPTPARPDRRPYEIYFGFRDVPVEPLVRELASDLRRRGAEVVLVLSHLGLPDDRQLAPRLDGVVDAIIGGHTHELLPCGERYRRVAVAHAGELGRYLGRLDLALDAGQADVTSVTTIPVSEDVAPHPRVLDEIDAIDDEIACYLDEVIGELADELDWAADRECGVGAFTADVVRQRMAADVGVATIGPSFTRSLPAGPLRRRTLFEACPALGTVPSVTEMSGGQLRELVARGLDAERAAARPRALRFNPQGLLHVSGAAIRDGQIWVGGEPLDPSRVYRVAGTDWELGSYAGYADPAWALSVEYDTATQLRDAVEEHLAASGPIRAPERRISGSFRFVPGA